MPWQWKMMQNLKKNWLVALNLTWRIWRILTRALESLKNSHFNVLLLSKIYIVWAKNGTEELSFMTLKSHSKFGEESNSHFNIGMRNLTILTWALESLKRSFHFNGHLLNKVYIVWAKKGAEESSFMKLNSDTNFGKELTCRFKIDMRNLTKFDQSTRKSQKFPF